MIKKARKNKSLDILKNGLWILKMLEMLISCRIYIFGKIKRESSGSPFFIVFLFLMYYNDNC